MKNPIKCVGRAGGTLLDVGADGLHAALGLIAELLDRLLDLVAQVANLIPGLTLHSQSQATGDI